MPPALAGPADVWLLCASCGGHHWLGPRHKYLLSEGGETRDFAWLEVDGGSLKWES